MRRSFEMTITRHGLPPPPAASPPTTAPTSARSVGLGPDRHPHHPPPAQHRRRQVRRAGPVHALGPGPRVRVERFAGQPGGSWITHTVCSGTGATTRQFGVAATCSASHCAFAMSRRSRACKPAHAFGADQAPQLQRPEAPAERDAPVAVVPSPGRRPRSAGSSGWWTSRGRGARGRGRSTASSRTPRPSHLCGLSTSESARSTPSHIHRHSGRIIADPAIAASTCSHRLCRSRDLGDRPDRVEGGGGGRAGRRDHGTRHVARCEVGRDQLRPARRAASRRRRRAARRGRSRGRTRRAAPPSRPSCGSAPRRTPSSGRGFGLQPAAGEREVRGPLAGAEQRDQVRGRGRVLDHAAPGVRQPDHLPHPVA